MPHVAERIQFEEDILTGVKESPYQYRVLKPLLTRLIETVIAPVVASPRTRHILSHSIIVFACFLGIYYFFFAYLRHFFSVGNSIIGLLLLQAVIPLAVTGYYMAGDFITVLIYILGFLCFLHKKDHYLPLLILVGAFNREQVIFLLLLYLAYLYSVRQLLRKDKLLIVAASIIVYAIVFIGLRLYFGFKPSPFSIAHHLSNNTAMATLLTRTVPLWLAQIAGFLLLSLLSFKRSDLFFRLSLISLAFYVLAFFLKGNLWELAKFLPAYLILIPMTLQTLTGESALLRASER
ncbi:MAG: hypothetical protein JSU65_04490 [Candidatus Zixiibacteriota bacterium]|nr:MAG: hypothetical protein JSU65_04490 [candidate division Zixibacteria bacterium]